MKFFGNVMRTFDRKINQKLSLKLFYRFNGVTTIRHGLVTSVNVRYVRVRDCVGTRVPQVPCLVTSLQGATRTILKITLDVRNYRADTPIPYALLAIRLSIL